MKKILGILTILVGFISMVLILIGTSMNVTFGLTGFTEENTKIIQWLVIRLLPIAGFLFLILPIGIFYINNNNLINKIQKIAFWFHFSSILLMIISAIPYIGCLTRISCTGGGWGEIILITIASFPAIGFYLIGTLLLVISWYKSRK
jgi:hypothetical protein